MENDSPRSWWSTWLAIIVLCVEGFSWLMRHARRCVENSAQQTGVGQTIWKRPAKEELARQRSYSEEGLDKHERCRVAPRHAAGSASAGAKLPEVDALLLLPVRLDRVDPDSFVSTSRSRLRSWSRLRKRRKAWIESLPKFERIVLIVSTPIVKAVNTRLKVLRLQVWYLCTARLQMSEEFVQNVLHFEMFSKNSFFNVRHLYAQIRWNLTDVYLFFGNRINCSYSIIYKSFPLQSQRWTSRCRAARRHGLQLCN